MGQDSLPKYALLISKTSVGMGGLGLLYSSHQTAPNFIINMTASMKCATNGMRLNKDLAPFKFCSSIAMLYSQELIPTSTYLRRFYSLIPSVAKVGCAPTTPRVDKMAHFLTRTPPPAHVDISRNSVGNRSSQNCMLNYRSITHAIYRTCQASSHPICQHPWWA